jgi:ubiquinone/menaquinone biosynthesis C-methylase UbiE
MHIDRSVAIAQSLEQMVPLDHSMKALEYGAGTGLLSFLLQDRFSSVTLMDNSREMINVCIEKAEYFKASHVHPLLFDLEHKPYDETFDLIYSQMVLHHVNDYEALIDRFYGMLNPGGYLAIADLFTEDGSFHGLDVMVHLGFDPEKLSEIYSDKGFINIDYKTCFEIRRELGRTYPVFLLVGQK